MFDALVRNCTNIVLFSLTLYLIFYHFLQGHHTVTGVLWRNSKSWPQKCITNYKLTIKVVLTTKEIFRKLIILCVSLYMKIKIYGDKEISCSLNVIKHCNCTREQRWWLFMGTLCEYWVLKISWIFYFVLIITFELLVDGEK